MFRQKNVIKKRFRLGFLKHSVLMAAMTLAMHETAGAQIISETLTLPSGVTARYPIYPVQENELLVTATKVKGSGYALYLINEEREVQTLTELTGVGILHDSIEGGFLLRDSTTGDTIRHLNTSDFSLSPPSKILEERASKIIADKKKSENKETQTTYFPLRSEMGLDVTLTKSPKGLGVIYKPEGKADIHIDYDWKLGKGDDSAIAYYNYKSVRGSADASVLLYPAFSSDFYEEYWKEAGGLQVLEIFADGRKQIRKIPWCDCVAEAFFSFAYLKGRLLMVLEPISAKSPMDPAGLWEITDGTFKQLIHENIIARTVVSSPSTCKLYFLSDGGLYTGHSDRKALKFVSSC